MSGLRIAQLQRVALRDVWQHEAYDFTRWLEDHLEILNSVTELGLHSAKREQAAGPFSVDLVAEDGDGSRVVIENQLTKSNHDHLGKLITYLCAFDAKAAVWIVSEARAEHVQAIARLNETSIADFYMLKVEAVQIDDSPVAPLLTLIVGPSREAREIGETKEELAERHQLRRAFWTGLLERAQQRTPLHSAISARTGTAIWAATGVPGTRFVYGVREHDAEVAVAIVHDDERGLLQYRTLQADQEEIERELGFPLEWDLVEGRQRQMIIRRLPDGGYRSSLEKWPRIQDTMIDAMIRLAAVMTPRLRDSA